MAEAWNKGIRFPHSPKWEAKRIAAVRRAAKRRIYLKGYTRPRTAIQPMLDAGRRNRTADPKKYNSISIANLPKNCVGANNGNWKGGRTAKFYGFRQANSGKWKLWRQAVLSRDGNKCRECGRSKRLEAHHIIPLSECRRTAFMVMNGVTLCRLCHTKTDSYAVKGRNKTLIESGIGTTTVLIRTIPHHFQAYETIGNWSFSDDGLLVVFVSDLNNQNMEFCVALHEVTEAWLCRKRGITQESVDAFDMSFNGSGEPGDSKAAPYHREHQFATTLERLLVKKLGVNWKSYGKRIDSVSS